MNIRKIAVATSALFFSGFAMGQYYMNPTIPGTGVRDYSQPGLGISGNNAFQTIPGTNVRDYSKPGFTMQGNTVYQTIPGTNVRDYSKPGWTIGR